MGFQTEQLSAVKDSPFRIAGAYTYDQKKVEALKESIETTSFWENLLARKTKNGVIQLAYGHHRLEALRQLVDQGLEKYKEIRINVRSEKELSDEMMLKIIMQENKDDWGEIPQNLCMSVLQVRGYLTNIVNACKDVGEFMKRIGTSAPAMKMDARSFSRVKNQGVGASTIAQFLGDTWSRQTIQDALQLIESGEQSEELRKLAETLPNVTLAHRFSKLVTKAVEGKGKEKVIQTFDDKTKEKVAKAIVNNDLTRADVEAAIKITDDQEEKDPLAAIDAVVKQKKADAKAAAEAAKAAKPAVVRKTPLERINIMFDNVREVMEKVGPELQDKKDFMAVAKRIDELSGVLKMLATTPKEKAAETETA